MLELTPSQKGAIAEAEITAAAVRLRVPVLRPLVEGCRYDLALDLGTRLLRVQCKWGAMRDGVVLANARTSRHTPHGYIQTRYTADEIDAVGVFSPETDACYLIPVDVLGGRSVLYLRVARTRNNQASGVLWASDFEMSAALERCWSPRSRNGAGRHGPAPLAFGPPGL